MHVAHISGIDQLRRIGRGVSGPIIDFPQWVRPLFLSFCPSGGKWEEGGPEEGKREKQTLEQCSHWRHHDLNNSGANAISQALSVLSCSEEEIHTAKKGGGTLS